MIGALDVLVETAVTQLTHTYQVYLLSLSGSDSLSYSASSALILS